MESVGGSKKRKEVGKESPLAFMFHKQQTVKDLQKVRGTYNVILEKGKQLALDETAHAAKLSMRTEETAKYKKMCEIHMLKVVVKHLRTEKKLESEKATGTQFTGVGDTKEQILT